MSIKSNDPRLANEDNVYINVIMRNDDPTRSVDASKTFNRDQAVIDNPNDYYMSIIRYQIPNDEIPLFYFKNNHYSVVATNGAAESKVFLQYSLMDSNPLLPIFRINDFVLILNNAITQACSNVGIPPANNPYVYLDIPGQVLKVVFPDTGPAPGNWAGEYVTPNYQIWFNWFLYKYFRTIPTFFTGFLEPANGKAYRLVARNELSGNYNAATFTYTMSQETSMLNLFISTISLFIASSRLPINPEILLLRQNGQDVTINSVTDFVPLEYANYGDNFTPYVYNPGAQYRLIDLQGSIPIKSIDFTVYYTDSDQNVYPLRLLPGQSISIKVLFVKKALFNNEFDGAYLEMNKPQ